MDILLERIIECIGPRHGAKKELAEHLGIHPNVITNWLNGRNKSYRRYVNEIAAFYGVSVDYLLGNADSKEKQPDSQNENQAVKDELIAFYGDVKDDLTPDDIDDLMDKLNKLDNKVCAVMFEFVQGEGGVIPLQQSFVNAIMLECAKSDILTIADEVQTGVGRTGKLLTSELYNVKPDITTLAKGLAGGVPIGVCLANKKCSEVLGKGTHGSTFGGNPISCAGGNAVLDKVTKPEFLEEVRKKGEYFREKLAQIDEVEGVDGLGLMIGVRRKIKKAADVLNKCFENGLLILTAKDKLRFLPPLNISYEQIDKGLAILKKVLDEK